MLMIQYGDRIRIKHWSESETQAHDQGHWYESETHCQAHDQGHCNAGQEHI